MQLLDLLNRHHLYALHFTYLPRINASLQAFKEGWNHHHLSTVKGMSPAQIFFKGLQGRALKVKWQLILIK